MHIVDNLDEVFAVAKTIFINLDKSLIEHFINEIQDRNLVGKTIVTLALPDPIGVRNMKEVSTEKLHFRSPSPLIPLPP